MNKDILREKILSTNYYLTQAIIMAKIEDIHRIIVRPTSDGELIATYYDENDDYEVEIKVVE